ncbi:MAG: hypothetical protein KIT54_07875 [Phycisphaeraceae bacterium]|nr:hypothetical protein [Phycisphaeraceae bacterium]
MSTISRTQQGTLDFFNLRIADWAANAEQLELNPDDLATLSALLSAAQSNFDAAKQLEIEYRAAVDLQDESIEALYNFGSLLVQQIRVAAKKDGTDTIYALAKIDPPKDRTPRTVAPVPTGLSIRATSFGDLTLTFEANKGLGSVFIIERQTRPIGGQPGTWVYADTISEKAWTDNNVPNGVASVRYRVRTKLTNGVLSDWSDDKGFFFGTSGNQAAPTQAQQASGGGGGGGQSLTIEDAQALKDAQTAKGAMKAS